MIRSPVVIELEGEPVAKGRPMFVSRGKGRKATAITPSKTAAYEKALGWAARAVMGGRPLLTGALRMSIVVKMSIPPSWTNEQRRQAIAGDIVPVCTPDIDNFVKCVCDSLNCIVYPDDKQIAFLTASKWYSERPSLWVEISTYGKEEEAK